MAHLSGLLAAPQFRRAAVGKPYVKDNSKGWVGAGKSAHEALLAAMLFIFEEFDFQGPVENELAAAMEALATAQQVEGQPDVPVIQARVDLLKYKTMIQDNLDSGAGRTALLDLIGCQQVKQLSTGNMEGYFKSFDLVAAPSKAVSFVAYWAAISPPLYNREAFQVRIASCLFVKYHTNATTTPELCHMALGCAPYSGFFTQAEELAIEAAHKDMTSIQLSRAIPDTAVLKADLWLELMDRAPPKWYMKDKAVNRFPALHYSLMKGALKRAREIIKEEMGVDDDADMDAVKRNIDKLIAGSGTVPQDPIPGFVGDDE